MKRRSLLNGAIAITVVVLGVTLLNLIIKGACYLLLAMFKYPVETLFIMIGLTGLIVLADIIYDRYEK